MSNNKMVTKSDLQSFYQGILPYLGGQIQADFGQTDNTQVDFIKNKPTLGTAAAKDVPSSGDATSTQVVLGNDTRLDKANTAYQLPQNGIPKTDLASAVQTSLGKADGAGYWVSGQDKTINSTSTTSIQFTVPNAGYAYDPYFESANGTPVYVQGESKSGTTLTYTIRALTSAQLPCKAKLLAIPVASA